MNIATETSISAVRRLVSNYNAAALTHCLDTQIQTGHNACYVAAADESVGVLAKAEFIAAQMQQQGLSLNEALRELGRRMRALQANGD